MSDIDDEASAPQGLKKTTAISPAAAAIQTMQRLSDALVRQEASLGTALIRTADTIVTTLRSMSQTEQEEIWRKAVSDRHIRNRQELCNGVAALTALALDRTSLSAASVSQFRTVVRYALETGGTVASLVGKGTIWSAYKTLRAPGSDQHPAPEPALCLPPCHLRLDGEEAARAAAEGTLYRLEGDQKEGYRLVRCGNALDASTAGLVIDGDAEEVMGGAEATPPEDLFVRTPTAEERPWFCTAQFTVSRASMNLDAKKLLQASAALERPTDPTVGSNAYVWTLVRDTPEVRAIIAAHDPQPWPRRTV